MEISFTPFCLSEASELALALGMEIISYFKGIMGVFARILQQFSLGKHKFYQMHILRGLVVLLLLIAVGCKTARKVTDTGNKTVKESVILEQLKAQRVGYQKLSISGKARIERKNDFSMSANYRINMIADSLIWIRVSKLGIEGLRVLIRKDSVFVLDRLNRQAIISDYSPAEKFTGLQANLSMLEDLILGNFYLIPDRVNLQPDEANQWVFSGSQSQTDFQYAFEKDKYKLVGMEAKSATRKQHTEIQYDKFEKTLNQWVPYEGLLSVWEPDSIKVSFKHNNISHNPQNFSVRFSIPSNYDRITE